MSAAVPWTGKVDQWFRSGDKAVRFAVVGALGCLAGALVGELLLLVTRAASPPVPSQAVCLLIDCSGSMLIGPTPSQMHGEKLREVKAAANGFIQRQNLSRDLIAVVGFGTDVRLACPLSHDKQQLVQSVDSLDGGGGTAMDAGLNVASSQLLGSPEKLPAGVALNILLFTDGKPDDEDSTLTAAAMCRERKIKIVAIATGDADVDYLARVTGSPALVFSADAGNFDEGFHQAEKAIFGGSLVESSDERPRFLAALAQTGAWTALLAVGVALALIAGQNLYLNRAALSGGEAAIGVAGAIAAGLVGGAAGQLFFSAAQGVSNLPAVGSALGWTLTSLGRVLGWAILGALLARGLAFFVPNLPPRRAWAGGGLGGALAGAAFVLTSLGGDVLGRLLGAAILGLFIGILIALIEAASREAWLEIRRGLKEVTYVSLGATPVRIGSDRSSTVYARGARPIACQYRFQEGQVTCLDYATEKLAVVEPGDERVIGSVTVTVRTAAPSGAAGQPAASVVPPSSPAAPGVPPPPVPKSKSEPAAAPPAPAVAPTSGPTSPAPAPSAAPATTPPPGASSMVDPRLPAPPPPPRTIRPVPPPKS